MDSRFVRQQNVVISFSEGTRESKEEAFHLTLALQPGLLGHCHFHPEHERLEQKTSMISHPFISKALDIPDI